MRRLAMLAIAALVAASQPIAAQTSWSTAQAENLYRWMERASDEGITLPRKQRTQLRSAIDAGDIERLTPIASEAALTLTRAWRGRCCGPRKPVWWRIDGSVGDAELGAGIEAALVADRLDLFLRSVRPQHPQYSRLVNALVKEDDPSRRSVILSNLARWRWLPARLGERYLLVNIAAQQLTLWEGNSIEGRWRVIVGKPVTRTPVFTTQVKGVVLNPWWEIPSSIAAEGIASFVRHSPSAARARGYVRQNGRYRQMPGDNNALGRMKLIMPNPYRVYLHDTSKRELFGEDQRFFSHGCVRVDQALSFVATLFAPDGWDLPQVEGEVATERTRRFELSQSIPLYVTYFTAEPLLFGGVRYWEDVYNRDPVKIPDLSFAPPESASEAIVQRIERSDAMQTCRD